MSLELGQAKTALVVIDMTKGVLSLASGPYPVQKVLANTVRLSELLGRRERAAEKIKEKQPASGEHLS